MKTGDVVRYQNCRWRVQTHSQELRLCTLVNFNGDKTEVPDDLDQGLELKVLYNPETWPFVSIPVKSTFGRITGVSRSRLIQGETETVHLEPLIDWLPGDFLKAGGSIHFNPRLQLKHGEVLVALHESGKLQRIAITKSFGTMKTKVKRAEKPEPPADNYKRILVDDVFGED